MNISLKHKVLGLIITYLIIAFPLTIKASALHPVKRGDKYGYAGEDGKLVISARFAIAMDFGEGLAYVAETPDRQGSWKHGFIDERGKWVAFLDGKSFRPSLLSTEGDKNESQAMGYGELHDYVVFRNGFAELPSYNSTGGQDFETSSVWINRHQMMEMVGRFGKESPIRPTSRIFFTKLLKGDSHILGVCAKARNTKGPNGVLAFDEKEHKPVTSIQAGENNEWFGSFGIMRYTGNTYLVYHEGDRLVKYFDEVTVLQSKSGDIELLAKGLGDSFLLYSTDIRPLSETTYHTVGEFMRSHHDYFIVETEDYISELPELQSRRLRNFSTMAELEDFYLSDNGLFNKGRIPVCRTIQGDAKPKLRIASRCGAVMISDYDSNSKEAWLWDFTTNSKLRVSFPFEIDASGMDGQNGEDGAAGASGRPKLTYRDGNVTKTEAGTCGEAGGDGRNGRNGENGATLLVIMDRNIPEGYLTINVDGGAGGKGGAGGVGGIHGVGSSCKGKARDGKAGKDGTAGKSGKAKFVMIDY